MKNSKMYPFFPLGKHTEDGKNIAKFATESDAQNRADELISMGFRVRVEHFSFGADYWFIARINKYGKLFNVDIDAE